MLICVVFVVGVFLVVVFFVFLKSKNDEGNFENE